MPRIPVITSATLEIHYTSCFNKCATRTFAKDARKYKQDGNRVVGDDLKHDLKT